MAPPGRDWLRMWSHFGHQRQKLWLRDFDLAAHSRENKRGSHSAPRPHQSNRGLTRSLLTPANHHRKPCVFCKATSDTFRLRLELPFRLVPVPFGKKGIALRVYLPTLVKDPSGVGRIPILDFHLDGKQLSLQQLITSGVVSGQVSFALTASGTTKKPKVHFQVPASTTVEILGQAWMLEGIDIEVDKDMLVVKLCHVAAKAGGDIRIEGHVNLAHKPLAIDWTIKILDLPIAAILATAKVEAPVSGRLSIDLHVT